MKGLPEVSYHSDDDTLQIAMQRRKMQLKNFQYKLEQTHLAAKNAETQSTKELNKAATQNILSLIRPPYSYFLGFLQPPRHISKSSLYQMTALYHPHDGECLELTFSLNDTREAIRQGTLNSNAITITVSQPHYFLPLIDNYTELNSPLEHTMKTWDCGPMPLTITSLIDITLHSIATKQRNQALEKQFAHGIIYNYTRECINWRETSQTIHTQNLAIANKLARTIFDNYYDGTSDKNGRAYVKKYRIYIKGSPTDWWLHSESRRTLVENIRTGNPVNIYGKNGSKIKLIIPKADEATLINEELTDQYLMQHITFANTQLLAPPGVPQHLLATLIASYQHELLDAPKKPFAPTIEDILEQGYHKDPDNIGHLLNRIAWKYLDEELT